MTIDSALRSARLPRLAASAILLVTVAACSSAAAPTGTPGAGTGGPSTGPTPVPTPTPATAPSTPEPSKAYPEPRGDGFAIQVAALTGRDKGAADHNAALHFAAETRCARGFISAAQIFAGDARAVAHAIVAREV